MPLFRSKVVVEARCLTPDLAEEIADWCGGTLVEEINPGTDEKTPGINVPTMDGPARASMNDWILKGSLGDFWPMKAHEFPNAYEPADA